MGVTFNHKRLSVNRNHLKGWFAERLAEMLYFCCGYTILRPQKRQKVQVDVLVRKADLLVVVEVKYRPRFDRAEVALGPAQTRRLLWQTRQLAALYPDCGVRLDVVHVVSAFPFVRVWENVGMEGLGG